ncbi:YbfB/YjiJ family MFS transporter [Pseudooceanicola sp. MF1-13]|uniref:YbfB/YjiJ family MFS transporter n=1 Tax=Pseudooceanicola sp. MF1-13 TaxID=3379095 RepID=UPI003891810A
MIARPWLIALGLALGVAVSNGFARFAYGLILPAMRDDLSWSYAEAGWINTANALGYLGGALLTLALIKRFPPTRLFVFGMVGTSASLLFSGLTEDFALLTMWRITAGVAGAPVFIAGGVLAGQLFPDPKRAALAIALYFGGGGLGMLLTGATLPALFAVGGAGSWPMSWIALGLVSGAFTLLSARAVKQIGRAGQVAQAQKPATRAAGLPIRDMGPALVGYGFFAMGYIVYVTFVAAWMRDIAAGPGLISAVWSVIGLGIVVSPFIWRGILARFSNGVPLALAAGVTALGTVLPLVVTGPVALIISATLFGVAVFIGPAAITAFAKRNLPVTVQGSAIALFTTVFAVGQAIGPVAAGFIGDATGSIDGGLLAAGGVLALGAAVAVWQKTLDCPGRSDRVL